ncbi:type I restriction-modification system subunit M [Patescibacteria group bacterium]|nr:type I restriction-modification system subunit M [Patescibacteria group bacterium]
MTKEQERSELHRAIWQIANDLRGSVDGWDFKQYVLGMLFYRFISENLTDYINSDERRTGNKDFDYANLSDEKAELGRADTVKEKGFYILPSELFVNVCKRARKDTDLNETLASVFRGIENSAKGTNSEADLKGLFADLDVNSSKLGNTVEQRNKKLTKIIEAIGNLKLGNYSDNTIDAFGDAYEFLMTMYASNAGKSGGEFYTPQEVSELLAEITTVDKKEVNKVYDPACGSGSLLLKFSKVLGKENVRLGFFGQEINLTTYNLCRINMFLHDINYNNFDIALGDTLTNPKHWDDEPFDAIVSNPPYSIKWEGDANPLLINDPRFSPAGVLAPKSKADLAFTMHMLSWLSTSGTAAIVEFPGVLYRGGAEKKIRKYLIDNNYIDAVIQLPPDLFFGTSIATCVIVLKKSKQDNSVLFIDASEEFIRGGNKNKLSKRNREKILNTFIKRQHIEYFSELINNKDIVENDFNISVTSYVGNEKKQDVINIKELDTEIANTVTIQNKLRESLNEIVKNIETNTEKILNEGDAAVWMSLQDVCLDISAGGDKPEKYQKGQTIPSEDFPYPIFSNGTDENALYGYASSYKIDKEAVTISARGTIGYHTIRAPKFTPIVRLITLIPDKSLITTKFLDYILDITEIGHTGGSIPQLTTPNVKKIKIPVPPLETQNELTNILDKFTELEKELEKELEARNKQYEYYRNKLFSFKEYEN